MLAFLPSMAFSLLAALCWGGSDFLGGLITKRHSAFVVTLVAEIVGMVVILPLALLFNEPWLTLSEGLWAVLAGATGGTAVITLYSALALEKMGVVAPLAAVIGAGVPALVGMLTQGFPAALQIAGFGLALGGIWLLSNPRVSGIRPRGPVLAAAAGVSSGLFFVALDRASGHSALWPNFLERLVGLGLIMAVMAAGRLPLDLKGLHWPGLLLLGALDTGAAVLFTLGARTGRLDVATILSSFYPGGTVLLALAFLRERVSKLQWLGIALTLVAIAFIVA